MLNSKTNTKSRKKNDTNHLSIESLQKKLTWYESFFTNATDALFIIQPETWNVLDANESSAYLFNMSLDDLIGASLPQFRRIFKLLQKESSPKVLSELSLVTPNGDEIMVEVSARFDG